jgi:Phage integrase family
VLAGVSWPASGSLVICGQMADFCRLAWAAVEPAICAATVGWWPLKPMPGGWPARHGDESFGEEARRAAAGTGGPSERRRSEAVAKLRLGDFQHDGQQYTRRFQEKGGKSREIPVRHDLEGIILAYVDAAGIVGEAKDSPLFRASNGRSRKLAMKPLGAERICELVKRRLKDAGLPSPLSPHSFRVTAITSLLEQGVPMDDVQYLAGHAEPRTTGLYDRRQKKVTRNIEERISI